MKCSNCEQEIDKVIVISTCWQFAFLKDTTNIIENYGSIENIEKTTAIECSNCGYDLTDIVRKA